MSQRQAWGLGPACREPGSLQPSRSPELQPGDPEQSRLWDTAAVTLPFSPSPHVPLALRWVAGELKASGMRQPELRTESNLIMKTEPRCCLWGTSCRNQAWQTRPMQGWAGQSRARSRRGLQVSGGLRRPPLPVSPGLPRSSRVALAGC